MRLRRRGQDAGEGDKPRGDVQMPAPQQPATVELPSGERLPGRVAKRDGDDLLIMLMVPLAEPLSHYELRQIVLETSGGKGVTRLTGRVSVEDRDLLRFADVHALDVRQRREYVRVKAARTVLVTLPGGGSSIESCSVDISGGGMLLGGLDYVNVGEKISFRLTTDQDAPQITGTGRVVRCDPNGQRAIAFESISEGDRRRLIRFIFERQRAERNKGLMLEGRDGR